MGALKKNSSLKDIEMNDEGHAAAISTSKPKSHQTPMVMQKYKFDIKKRDAVI
jgi:hypothetical protein